MTSGSRLDRISPRALVTAGLIVIGILLIALTAARCSAPSAPGSAAPGSAATQPGTTTTTPGSGLPVVAAADLPVQARDVLVLIDQGGPFPYRQDGAVFSNIEGLLPKRAAGYYHEYTVPTPGSPDRGTRRLIVGRNGDVYYTGDHYESFRQVIR